MSGSENPKNFLFSFVNKDAVWFLITSVGNQTNIRNKEFRCSFIEVTYSNKYSLLSVYITRLHKSILGWDVFYQNTRLNTVPMNVLNTKRSKSKFLFLFKSGPV